MPHIHEKIDFIADVIIVNGDAVLLRKHDKYKKWWVPGGHIEPDEDPVEAALREAKEEVGLTITLIGTSWRNPEASEADFVEGGTDLIMPRFMNRHFITDTHEHVSLIYLATSSTREIRENDREKSDHIKWFTMEELDDPTYGISEVAKYYVKTALRKLGS